jgi:hypothetical protein
MELARDPVQHRVHGSSYEIRVYRVLETGRHHVYVAKNGFGTGRVVVGAEEDVIHDVHRDSRTDVVQLMIAQVIDDINRNDFGDY